MIAALFVQTNGVYYGLPNVDPWDKERDARLYPGPYPVVAHPPCARWGNYWFGSPSDDKRFELGNDDGCFEAALNSVRKYGGVLEHPKGSRAWKHYDLLEPFPNGGWSVDFEGGWTCCIDQGMYGHRSKKPTWLYMYGCKPPSLIWGSSVANIPVEHLSKKERAATPIVFRDLLIDIADHCEREGDE